MGASTRRRVTVVLALTAFACAVTVAVAASIKVNAPRTDDSQPETFAYFEGDSGSRSGEVGACVQGDYYGGRGQVSPPDGEPIMGDDCGGREGDTTLPDAVTGCNTVEECQAELGGGGDDPAPPCDDQASCEALVRDHLPEGDGGPEPPSGTPGAPTMRDCTSASGGEATCIDIAEGTFIVGDSPAGDMQGELGLCAGGGYFYVAGVDDPKGAPGDADCPTTGDDTGGGGDPGDGGGGPAPPCTDQASCQALIEGLAPDGGGGAPTTRDCASSTGGEATCVDFGDGNFLVGDSPEDGTGELGFCTSSEQAPSGPGYYYVGGLPPDGDAGVACPAPPAATGGAPAPAEPPPPPPPSDSGTSPPPSTGPAQVSELPHVEITRDLKRVSRRGYVEIPLACRSTRTACVGELTLSATRRTRSGRRVRVLLAETTFRVAPGEKAERRTRLTSDGRELLADRGELDANARMLLRHDDGTTVQRDELVLRPAR